jgi:hypothetical protein
MRTARSMEVLIQHIETRRCSVGVYREGVEDTCTVDDPKIEATV